MDFEFLILETLYNSPRREADQDVLYNLVKGAINEIDTAIKDLVDIKFIKRVIGSTKYKLTSPTGVNAYKQLKKEREQDAKNERQQRFDNKISIASILVPLVTFIFGLLIEHFTSLVSSLLEILKQSFS